MFADRVLQFYRQLDVGQVLPKGVELLHPYQSKGVMDLCARFFNTYYKDNNQRRLILGINPGRLGGGLTGISFTDPIQLKQMCGIENELPKKAELSSTFIYKMIETCGGTTSFYNRFFISAVCPLGFVKEGKNLNYYDLPELQKTVEPFIIQSMEAQIKLGVDTSVCFCLGEGKNLDYLKALNESNQYFKNIIALPHPRFIMQYKRKQLEVYLNRYRELLEF